MREARRVEMEFFERMGAWSERLPKHEVIAKGGKVIKGRWVDVNKGDTARPDYRLRFVGKEYNVGVDPTLYAATPPLEALKLLLGHAASDTTQKVHIMLSDVKRAYFHALAQRELYVELPPEDSGYQSGYVGAFSASVIRHPRQRVTVARVPFKPLSRYWIQEGPIQPVRLLQRAAPAQGPFPRRRLFHSRGARIFTVDAGPARGQVRDEDYHGRTLL